MEIIVEFFLEISVYAYAEAFEAIFDEVSLKKWQEILLKVLCAIFSMGSLVLVLIGMMLLTSDHPFKMKGLILLVVGVCILFIHVVLGLFARAHHKAEIKRKEALWLAQLDRKKQAQQQTHETNMNEEEN